MAGKNEHKSGAKKRQKEQQEEEHEKKASKPTVTFTESSKPVCSDTAEPSLLSQAEPCGQMETCSTASTSTSISTRPPTLQQSAVNIEEADSMPSGRLTTEASKQPSLAATDGDVAAPEDPDSTDPCGKVTFDDSVQASDFVNIKACVSVLFLFLWQ